MSTETKTSKPTFTALKRWHGPDTYKTLDRCPRCGRKIPDSRYRLSEAANCGWDGVIVLEATCPRCDLKFAAVSIYDIPDLGPCDECDSWDMDYDGSDPRVVGGVNGCRRDEAWCCSCGHTDTFDSTLCFVTNVVKEDGEIIGIDDALDLA